MVQATVAIRSSDGTFTLLTEVAQGLYETPETFRTEVGKSYTLIIETSDGNMYTSLPEHVEAVPELRSVSYSARRVPTQDRLQDAVGVALRAHFDDPAAARNFYYWRLSDITHVVLANPELFTLPPDHPTDPRGPAPKDCCSICYLDETPRIQPFRVSADTDFNGLSTSREIAFIADNGLRFRDTYRARVQQISISASAHRFLTLVEQQLNTTGSVFDQPPAMIRGNMVSLTDPNELVLGYFIAGAESSRHVYVQAAHLTERATPALITDDCRVIPNTNTERPADWSPPPL
ncbi:hypothetical protein A3SI_15286 [Nitritalea halalkaliphila LW7]|uniref:Uncharacterized protein n=1 Tax=Nitritalea halalkaliphila LW7 TaxID=1189621 RepID=I5BZ02_9BACT|nr:DUF4249 domain-containing protein [Nitritalea halalkaliphila]EIM74804.1 hypothetical protein A3SI_15286 [Nitritalea halalkaliphila LW7]